ncbi:hypothetical protein [Amycolatopsis sp. SID8362]|uniref:hypothetical protein n=1 Tax=Amycolatopsis sp. SID8362 TaxID=2690346 RepID=UPI0013686140|nr:hypothetical protein [Amycolatopsis sp. SID8362]NBH12506.1 hypothetical protein [Amycolatopsis sp. SID8362]NED49198.1 hypothetical protein [Amycolatopsis sp. SID8362]
MKRAGAAALLVAALVTLLAPVATAAEGPAPVAGMGGGPYIGDVPAPGAGDR